MPNSTNHSISVSELNNRIDEALFSCALEDMHPNETTNDELTKLRTGELSPDAFIQLLKQKYQQS